MKITAWLLLTFFLAGTNACKKSGDVAAPPKEEQTKFPPPTWVTDESGKYPATMTAVVMLPATLQANVGDGDQLAAFIDGECRGAGTRVEVENKKVYFVLIRGLPGEQSGVVFKYYNAKTSYLYRSAPAMQFLVDDVYGTAQTPKLLDLSPVK